MIDPHTVLCLSLAARPGRIGMALHNAGYRALGLNYLYKACAVTDLAGALRGVRALGIRGCGISMPFKEAALSLLDAVDPAAAAIGAVNTIVNDEGKLTGYNTDVVGAGFALNTLAARPSERVLLLGAGGVARAILYTLRERGFHSVQVAARDRGKVDRLQGLMTCEFVAWAERESVEADLVVNATPFGMAPAEGAVPLDLNRLPACRAVLDVVATPWETRLIREARALGKAVAPGFLLSLHQAAAQFRLYTGVEPPLAVWEAELKLLLSSA